MKKKAFMLLSSLALMGLLTACSTNDPNANAGHANADHSQMKNGETSHGGHGGTAHMPTKATWNVSDFKSGQESKITYQIQDEKAKPIENFEVTHEKKMHLIIVSKDLSYFTHIHPEYKGNGTFEINHVFPHGGEYEFIADFKPEGGDTQQQKKWTKVTGEEPAAVALQPDQSLNKTVEGIDISLKFDELKANKELTFTYNFKDANSKAPITNLQPYLGALGHVVILDPTAEQYLHVHPNEEKGSGPDAPFGTTFPKSGVYKVWGQFQRDGKIITVPFVVNVP